MSIPIEYIIDAQWRGSTATRSAASDLQRLDSSAKSSSTGIDSAGKSISGLGSTVDDLLLGGGLALAGSYLLDFGRDAVNAASDIQETTSLIDNSLGDASQRFREELDAISEATGRSANQLERGASTIVAMTRSMGLGQEQAASYSASFAQVALDLGSFFNQEPEQVFEDIQGALAGSSETLQKYGIDVRETTLQQAALNAGIIEQGESLSRTQRAYILQQEVIRQTADAQGDAARTSESYANQVRRLEDSFYDLQVVIGNSLLPSVTQLVTGLGDGVQEINDFVDANERAISRLDGINSALGRLAPAANPFSVGFSLANNLNNDALIRQEQARQAIEETAVAYEESVFVIDRYNDALQQQADISEAAAANESFIAESVSQAGDAYFDTGESLATYTDRVAAYNARLGERQIAEAEAAEAAEAAAEQFAEAQQRQAQALADSFSSGESLIAELFAAQEALTNAEGLGQNAEEEAARVVAANDAIIESYQQVAVEGLLSNVESYEELQRNIAAAVDAGIISEQQAEARLEFAETTAAIEDLNTALDAGDIASEQYGEIFNAITTGVAETVPEAIERLTELDESFATLGDGLDEEPLTPVVETEEAETAVDDLSVLLAEFTEAEYLAMLQADSDPALDVLETLRTDMTTYDDTVYEAILDAEQDAALAAIQGVNAQLDAINGRVVTATVNVNVNQAAGQQTPIPGFATGVSGFRVPSGFPNDSYLIGVTSGEVVDVRTPSQQVGQGNNQRGSGFTYVDRSVHNYRSREAAAVAMAVRDSQRKRRVESFMEA